MDNIFFNKEKNFKNESVSTLPIGNNSIIINNNDLEDDLKKESIHNKGKPMLTGNNSTVFVPDGHRIKTKPSLSSRKVPTETFSQIANQRKNLHSQTSSDMSSDDDDDDDDSSDGSEQLLSGQQSRSKNYSNISGSSNDEESDEDDYSTINQSNSGHLKHSGTTSQASSDISGTEVSDDDSDDGSDDSGSEESSEKKPKKTYEDIQKEKQQLLFDLERLNKQGYTPSKRYSMASAIEELKYERDRLKKQRDVEKSINFSRKALMAVVSGIEYLNTTFDPFDIKLKGWSENLMENIADYDEVFEELHDKYGDKVNMAPELRLIMMIAGSGFMFHLTNSIFKSAAPNLNDVLRSNPDIMRNIQEAAAKKMSSNISNQMGPNDPIGNMMRDGINMKMNGPSNRPSQPKMSGPSGVDDLLNELSGGKDDSSVSTSGSVNMISSSRRSKTSSGKKKGINLNIF